MRFFVAALLGFIVLSVAGCQLTTTVDIDVQRDGSGVVTATATLDAEAAKRMPDLEQSVLVGDLKKAGWSIDGPRPAPDGSRRIAASKGFDDSRQLSAVIEEVAGPDGAFHDFELSRSHRFAKTSYELTGTIDLSGGLDRFGDEALRKALGGTMSGRSDAQLAQELGRPPAEALQFELVTHLPGGGRKEWKPRLGDAPSTISATGSDGKPMAWLFAFVAMFAFAGFVATVLLILRYNRIKAPPSYLHRPGGHRRPWDDDLQ